MQICGGILELTWQKWEYRLNFKLKLIAHNPIPPNYNGVLPKWAWHELPIRSFAVYFPHNLQAAFIECGRRHLPPHPLGITTEVLVPVSLELWGPLTGARLCLAEGRCPLKTFESAWANFLLLGIKHTWYYKSEMRIYWTFVWWQKSSKEKGKEPLCSSLYQGEWRHNEQYSAQRLFSLLLSTCLVLPSGLPRLVRFANLFLRPLQLFILREPKTTPELMLFEAFSLEIFVFAAQIFHLEEACPWIITIAIQ